MRCLASMVLVEKRMCKKGSASHWWLSMSYLNISLQVEVVVHTVIVFYMTLYACCYTNSSIFSVEESVCKVCCSVFVCLCCVNSRWSTWVVRVTALQKIFKPYSQISRLSMWTICFPIYTEGLLIIFKPISFSTDMANLQLDLDNISSWLTSHLLHLNSSKSKYMFFSHKSSSNFDCFPPLSISHTPIDRVSSYRYLGVLSSSLSWAPHIAATCSKARKFLALCSATSVETLLLPP